jgi:hypothetical protein
MPHVFISYSKKNHDYANRLANFLMEQGFDIWIDDRSISYGDEWWNVIVNAIMECAAHVLIMTPESQNSKWVRRELNLADHLDKPLFPLLLEGENWPIFVGTQYADLRDGSLPELDFCDRLSRFVPRLKEAGADVTEMQIPDEPPVDAGVLAQIEEALSIRESQGTPIQARGLGDEDSILQQINAMLQEPPEGDAPPEEQDARSTASGASDDALQQLDDLLT